MRRLHIVGGLFSLINSLSAAPVGDDDEHYVLVLFTYDPDREPQLRSLIDRVVSTVHVRFLYDPSGYTTLLGDASWMNEFCPDPDEVRMFFTHNTWLHNRVFRSFPSASVVLFEEGTASYYPGLLHRYDDIHRIERVATHNYLASFRPMDAFGSEHLFSTIDRRDFLHRLERLGADPSGGPFVGDGRDALLLEQYFFKKGDAIRIEEQADLYASAVTALAEKGYRVWYKGHPREPSELQKLVLERLTGVAREVFEPLTAAPELFESLLLKSKPAAVVAVNSTGLLTAPHLFGVPAFRIDTDIPIRVARSVPVERRGLVVNHVAFIQRLPDLAQMPSAEAADSLWPRFAASWESLPTMHEDPLLRHLASSDFGVEFIDLVLRVLDPSLEWVSFDLFDTLVQRPATEPSDIYYLLDRPLRDLLSPFTRFSNARRVAIQRLRARDKSAGVEKEEYTLGEIYAFLADFLGIDEDLAAHMHEQEVELEERLVQSRQSGLALFGLAGICGKKRALLSDTYFDLDELARVAMWHLPQTPDLVLASSDVGVTKRTGSLFDVLLSSTGAPAERILHIGDSMPADVELAKSKGMGAAHFPSSTAVAAAKSRRSQAWRGYRQEKGSALVEGLITAHQFDNPFVPFAKDSLFGGQPYSVGYSAVGPALLGWTLWAARTAQRQGYDRLLFLSRDGYVPFHLYRRLSRMHTDLPEARYVHSSRKAALTLFGSDRAHIALTEFVHGVSPENSVRNTVMARFGSEALDALEPALARAGFGALDEPVGRDRVELFKMLLADESDTIIRTSARRAELARRYFRQVTEGADHPALVDVGYSGSSQRAIALATEQSIAGLYWATMEHNVEYSHIMGLESHAWSSDRVFFHNGAVLEYFITPPGLPECVGFEDARDGVAPRLRTANISDPQRARVHAGVSAFLDDVLEVFGTDTIQLVGRADLAHRMLSEFLSHPPARDVEPFRLAPHDDSIGSNRGSVLAYWPQARETVRQTRSHEARPVKNAPDLTSGAPSEEAVVKLNEQLRSLPRALRRRLVERLDRAIRWRVSEATAALDRHAQEQDAALSAVESSVISLAADVDELRAQTADFAAGMAQLNEEVQR